MRRHEPDRRRPRDERPRKAEPDATAGAIEALQRSAGNAAVARLLSRAPLTAPDSGPAFSDEELRWIDEVWATPEIELLFSIFPSIPRPILERVQEIVGDDGARTDPAGITRDDAQHIELADRVYTSRSTWNRTGSDEAEFKSTLIHELFHVFESWSQELDPAALQLLLPEALVAALMTPATIGEREYAFGWFVHPRLKTWWHFEKHELYNPGYPEANLVPEDPEYAVGKDPERWEASPDGRDPEEDIATSVGLYLSSRESRSELRTKHPRRFRLLAWYFNTLWAQLQVRGGTPLQ